MKYVNPLLLVILTISIFACKKKENNTVHTPPKRLRSSFTGMRTWRHISTYMLHVPDRDTTVSTGSMNFEITEINRDTICIGSDRLWFESSEGDSSRFVLKYRGSDLHIGWRYMDASFVHTPTADTIFYSTTFQEFGHDDRNSYVTP